MNLFADYIEFRDKVDQFWNSVANLFDDHMQCKPSCDGCCIGVSDLDVSWIEADIITRDEALKKLNHGKGCVLLNADGICSIYDHRPVVCRSWGLPLKENVTRHIITICESNKFGDLFWVSRNYFSDRVAELNKAYCEIVGKDPTETVKISCLV